MKISKIVNYLESKFPLNTAHDMDYGKIGLQFGSLNADVKKVMIALDGSSSVVDEALKENVDLLLLHHPFMFSPLLNLNYDSAFGKKVVKVIKNDLNVFAMHTNFDVGVNGMNDILAKKLLLSNIEMAESEVGPKNLLRIGEVTPCSLNDFALQVSELLEEKHIRTVGNRNKIIKKVGIVGGAGASELHTAYKKGCDVLVTGEVHHHQALDALDLDIALIEVSHSVERHFANVIKEELEREFPDVEFIVSENNINPFE